MGLFKFEEVFSAAVLLDYLKERKFPEFLGLTLFPEKKIEEIDLEYIKGGSHLPVSASVHAFNSESEIASRDALKAVKERLALVKRKIRMDEELLIKLQTPRTNKEFEKAKEQVFNDVDTMVLAVLTRAEAMRMEVLTTGKLSVNENGVNVTLDYGVPSDALKTNAGNSAWTHADSDPLKDIYDWTDSVITRTGVIPTRALTSSSVLSLLLRHDKVRKNIFGNANKLVTKAELNAFLEQQGLPKFASYDAKYRKEQANGTYQTLRFFDANKVVLMPDGFLGETVYGLTAEEIELAGTGIDTEHVGNVLAMTYRTADPVARWTKAVATVLPSFPEAENILIAKVK